MAHVSEYEVETRFIERLESIGYNYIQLDNYNDVLTNFREQLALFNAEKLMEAKGTSSFSDAEFNRVLIHMDNHIRFLSTDRPVTIPKHIGKQRRLCTYLPERF